MVGGCASGDDIGFTTGGDADDDGVGSRRWKAACCETGLVRQRQAPGGSWGETVALPMTYHMSYPQLPMNHPLSYP